ncbi:MAG: Ig-like domain repeat protein [Solirubrobacteraceae bacterium]
MGERVGNLILGQRRRGLIVLAGVVLTVLGLVAFGPGRARAAACDTSWTGLGGNDSWYTAGNWSSGVPSSSTNACITLAGTYTVVINPVGHPQAEAESLTLGGATGTQTVEIQGFNDGTAHDAALLLDNSSSISSNGAVLLTAGCSGGGCATGGAEAALNLAAGTLANGGTISTAPGTDSGAAIRALHGNLNNTGTINVNAASQYTGGTLNNTGTISVASGREFQVVGTPASLTNGSGGSITNTGGSGLVSLTFGSTFNQGAGTTSPNSANAAHPAVIVDDSKLNYTGSGASTIAAREEVPVTGDLVAGQNLLVQGAGSPCLVGEATWAGSWSSAGTITMSGSCSSGVKTIGGTFFNSGTLTSAPGANRFVRGSLSNTGTFNVNGPTAFPTASSTLSQTSGTTLLSAQTLDMTGSAGTFQLQGGLLQGTGTSVLNGSLNNSGGSVLVGSASASGHMTVGGSYSQGSSGRLTVVINGTAIGSGYSQLSMGGPSSLNGTLAINTLSGPQPGKLYTILGGGNVSGTFSSVLGRFVPNATSPTAGYKVDYFNTAVGLDAEAMFKLTVKKAGPGTGVVTSSPAGINCGSKCQAFFFASPTVKLTEHPGAGWVFNRWTGACTAAGSAPTCQVKMTKARTVTATFSHRTTTRLSSSKNPSKKGRRVTYTATVSPHPDGGTVKFTDGGRTLAGCGAVAVSAGTGKAKCTTRYRSTGSHRIQAKYSGDTNFAGSKSSVLTQRVKR